MIDLITTYYGNAIRQNKTCLSDMRKAVWAVYFHIRSSDEEPLHSFCPVGPNSWCKYQNQVVEGSVETFRHNNKLPVAVMDAIKPVFNDYHNLNFYKMSRGLHAEIVEVEIEVVSPSIVPSGNFTELNRTVNCMVLKANDRRTSCPCHDEFRGPRSDYVRQARRNRRQTAGEIARHTTQATGRPISRFAVARRLHGGGLIARRLVRCVPLTPAHRRRRSLWCREHRNWRDNEWGRVLFTDESRFSLSSDSHRILIWRERGSCNHPSNIIERDRYGGRGVLVWEGIMLGNRTDLHIFDAGSVNGTRYCNEILLPYVRLFRGAMGLQFLFMDDNAPCHRTVAAEQLLESEDIERMDWPAGSSDLNLIEHVWDFLGTRLAARTLPPVTIRELQLALQDEWAAMPQQLIDTLILSMGRRCETCLLVRGDHIPY
ncbi:transposable element Tcb2 transposase [Trichonephila clavipes]|nr:transposable element Tcb2 transposase [Trichonephila clavipes]